MDATRIQPQRLADETREDYSARRAAANKEIKDHLKGKIVWNSAYNGTYVKAEHGELA
jgi:DNA-binding transcriptional MocR family regulator